jgi:murein DD-endopeptidase MepM/ murein hydrolase activator NlpD
VKVLDIIAEGDWEDMIGQTFKDFGGFSSSDASKDQADADQTSTATTTSSVTSNDKAPEGKPLDAPVTQPFGKGGHPGVDLGAKMGTPVHAPISGTVQEAGVENGCGNTVSIINGNEKHRFCHLISINVRSGQQVRKGDVLGVSGGAQGGPTQGWSTGPHLHWEKYIAGRKVDPMTA